MSDNYCIYTPNEWEEVKTRVGKIESDNRYNITGGAGNLYHGRYQMGKLAIKEAAEELNIPIPSIEEFKNKPRLQDKLYRQFITSGDTWLKQNSKVYKGMTETDRKKVLPMLQLGAGNVRNFLDKGVVKEDAFKTPITKFRDAFNDYKWESEDID